MRTCEAEGCVREHYARGLCQPHYQQRWRRGRLDLAPLPAKPPTPCSIEGCDRFARARGMCNAHYNRARYRGDLGPSRLRARPGDGSTTKDGYRIVAGQLEHRVVMEQMLGRPLTSDESVHHVNGNRADNRPGNLELWSTWQPSGQRVEDKIAYAVDLLRRYAPERLIEEDGWDSPQTGSATVTSLSSRRVAQ